LAQDFGPEDRHLFETIASELYRQVIQMGSIDASDPAIVEHDQVASACKLLVDIGLLVLDAATSRYYPLDPAAVQSQIVVPLGRRGTELLDESAKWADTFSSLSHLYRQSAVRERPIVELRGKERINKFIQAALADCRQELLTAQPRGRRPEKVLAEAVHRDLSVLDKGVSMRTLYQHAARHSPATREYVVQVSARGAEVRTLDEFFNRLIVMDRRMAIIPGEDGDRTAVAIHERSLVSYLVDIFERSWERARPFTNNEAQVHRDIATDIRNMTIRMLVEGHSDPASAKRLGISTRTYAAYIAALKEEYAVQTRFQLGYAMGRGEVEQPAEPLDA
jgi:sugar-specific transcriptional regulator TrmB